MQIFSTAGTKYLSHTTASARNRYRLPMACRTTAPFWRCSLVKKSGGKSSMAGGVQVIAVATVLFIVSVRACGA